MRFLYVIPARGGSKGIPHKNIKKLGGRPLISYSIDVAKQLAPAHEICVTTDDEAIAALAAQSGVPVPFMRPDELATDHVGTYEVLLHALDFYVSRNQIFDAIVLLQPTSPFRTAEEVKTALSLYSSDVDMVVSVKESATNPYYNAWEEKDGFLVHSKGDGTIIRRQDAPPVWEYNGAIYVINIESLKKGPLSQFKRIKKMVMSGAHSIDLDTPFDWKVAELLLQEKRSIKCDDPAKVTSEKSADEQPLHTF